MSSSDNPPSGAMFGAVPGGVPADPPGVPGFELLKRLGGGGEGEVWLAEQKRPFSRLVAIKYFRTGSQGELVISRFRAERDALARLPSSGFCAIHDAGIAADGRPYLVREFVDGPTFLDACRAPEATVDRVLDILERLAKTLAAAHRLGIIHLDLKPSNVIIAGWPDHDPEPRLIDFGLSRGTGTVGLPSGTLGYTAPEVLRGGEASERADVYSLGKMVAAAIDACAPPLSPACADAMRRLAARCTAHAPGDRPANAGQMASELAAIRARLHRRGQPAWIVAGLLAGLAIVALSVLLMRASGWSPDRSTRVGDWQCVDLARFLNARRSMIRSGGAIPEGMITLEGTPFLLGADSAGAGSLLAWSGGIAGGGPPSVQVLEVPVDVTRALEVRIVMGTLWGHPGEHLVDVELVGENGSIARLELENGRDIRDYHAGEFLGAGRGREVLRFGAAEHLDVVTVEVQAPISGQALRAIRIVDRGAVNVSRALVFAISVRCGDG